MRRLIIFMVLATSISTACDGKRGPRGNRGYKGDQGNPGPKGEKGDEGDLGRDGRDGTPGTSGIRGEDGRSGRDGQDGHNGRDGSNGRDGHDGRYITNRQVCKTRWDSQEYAGYYTINYTVYTYNDSTVEATVNLEFWNNQTRRDRWNNAMTWAHDNPNTGAAPVSLTPFDFYRLSSEKAVVKYKPYGYTRVYDCTWTAVVIDGSTAKF